MESTRGDLDSTRQQLDSAIQVSITIIIIFTISTILNPFVTFLTTTVSMFPVLQVLAKNSVSDIEKREKKVLEKKLGEMEDELKVTNLNHKHSTQLVATNFSPPPPPTTVVPKPPNLNFETCICFESLYPPISTAIAKTEVGK